MGDFVEAYGDNSLATLEPGEPDFGPGWQINSIWWKWTAPKTETVRISTFGSAFWAYFYVYTGDSLTNLTLVTTGDSRSDGYTTLNATAGTNYWIQVLGSGTYGVGLARVAVYPPVPPNDDFQNRIVLAGDNTYANGTTVGATAQTNDPSLGGNGQTVWYQWTAGKFGTLNLTFTNLTPSLGIFQFDAGIFTGSQLGSLHSIGGGAKATSAIVTNGQTYIIGVDGYNSGDFHLGFNVTEIDVPPNDNFSNRMVLSGPSVGVTNDNTRATLEKGEHEPASHTARGTLWYQWTAPAAGLVRMVAQANGFNPLIAVYQGNSLTSLKRVANSLQFPNPAGVICSFQTAAGQTYDIQVDGQGAGGRGPILFGIDLTSLQLVSPTNASTISAGTPPLFQVNTPNPIADGQLESVTYLAVNEDGEEFTLGTLTNPPFSFAPTNLEPGLITFFAIATNTDGAARLAPPVLVKVRPANDNFSNGISLGGYNWQASGYTAQATREGGEPGGSASVWWDWTAPSTGPVIIEAQLGDAGTALRKRTVTVYTGADVKHLKRVPWTKTVNVPDASQFFYFNAVNGTTYHVQVNANNPNLDPGTWPFLLRGSMQSVGFTTPTGQSFTEPIDIPVAITNLEDPATIERVDFFESDGYTNNQLIASIATAPYQFIWSNVPPANYTLEARLIKSDGTNPPSAFTSVSVRPINDNFTNRVVLQTNFSWMSHRIAGATTESGEPASNAPSAWWTWTAPADGQIYLSDPTHETSSSIAVYSGTNLTSLQAVPTDIDPIYLYSQVANVSNGVAYDFAVTPGNTPDCNVQLRFYPPPPNDDFSNRTVVSGSSLVLHGDTVGATREVGEPEEGGSLLPNTIWWSWTAPGTGFVTVSQEAGIWVLGSVFTGTNLTSLQTVASSGSFFTPSTFEVTSGTTYQLVLISYWGDEEDIGVNWDFTPTATNDMFAARATLVGTNINFAATNGGASTEPGEPPLAPGGSGRTLWWSWTAPDNGNVYLWAEGVHGAVMVETFTGDSLDTLQPIPGGGGYKMYFVAASNETYQIRFDATGMVTTPINLTFVQSPTNDYFTNAAVIEGTDISVSGTVGGSSAETNDPAAGWNTVWYSWTAPQSGDFTIAVTGGPSVSAYTGTNISSLAPAGSNNWSDSLVLNAQSNQTYYLEVITGFLWEPDFPGAGGFQLLLFPGGAPTNDNFANAQVVVGTNTEIITTNWAATLEPNDPPIVQWDGLRRTVWYEWQAPASGLLQLHDNSSPVFPAIGIYLGTNQSQLAMIGGPDAPVRSNEVVHILVDGQGGVGGIYDFGFSFTPAPPNDDIANATVIVGTSATLTADVEAATGESSNPGDRFMFQWRDVWWLWTPPGAGHVVITNLQAGSSAYYQVYSGSPTNLQSVANISTDGITFQFDAVPGTNYYIRGTWGSGPGAGYLDLLFTETLTAPALLLGSQSVKSSVASIPSLQLSSPQMLNATNFAFEISGPSSTAFQIEYSTDLVHWQLLQSGVLTNATQDMIDTNAAGSMRFYRILPQQ
jgi:hypothetical protein